MTDHMMDQWPARLAARRAAIGLTQERLAVAANVGSATVARIERGATHVLPSTQAAIERALSAAEVAYAGGSGPGVVE